MKANGSGDFGKHAFFNTDGDFPMSQTSKVLNQELPDLRLHMEYEKFHEAFKKVLPEFSAYPLIRDCVESYEKYYKLISLDNDYLLKNQGDCILLNVIERFTSLLASCGCIYSLQFLYDDSRMNNKQVYDNYRQKALVMAPKYPSYEEWFRSTVKNAKCDAILLGHVDILKGFFPNIVDSKMLASIFEVVDIVYQFYNKGLKMDMQDEFIVKHRILHQQLLTYNIEAYKESVRYLLEKGVVFDLSDNRRSGAVSYLEETDGSISIMEFCEFYKDDVSEEVRGIFNLILETEIACQFHENSLALSRSG